MIGIFEIIGVIGMILVCIGITKTKRIADEYFIIGGIFLTIYSISIGNFIFITLQIIVVIIAILDFRKQRLKRSKKKKK